MNVIYFRKDINNVTGYYYDIIFDALTKNGYHIDPLDNDSYSLIVKSINKDDYILVTSLFTFIKLYLLGYRNFIYWFQGVSPEENYVLLHSKLRFRIYSLIEKIALKNIRYKIGISSYLFHHFEKKYNIVIDRDTTFIMPCFNAGINKDHFFIPGKYKNNTFCYAGSMRAWQGFDNILDYYSKIEQLHPDVSFRIYTSDIGIAKEKVLKSGIRNYSIGCVPIEEVDNVLSECKFGFLLREDTIINNVATPTKLGSYLGNGLIPIFSSAIHAYRDLAADYSFLCCLNEMDDTQTIERFLTEDIRPEDVFNEYSSIFNSYLNREEYVKKLQEFLRLK